MIYVSDDPKTLYASGDWWWMKGDGEEWHYKHIFPAQHFGPHWNGWAWPVFDLPTILDILAKVAADPDSGITYRVEKVRGSHFPTIYLYEGYEEPTALVGGDSGLYAIDGWTWERCTEDGEPLWPDGRPRD